MRNPFWVLQTLPAMPHRGQLAQLKHINDTFNDRPFPWLPPRVALLLFSGGAVAVLATMALLIALFGHREAIERHTAQGVLIAVFWWVFSALISPPVAFSEVLAQIRAYVPVDLDAYTQFQQRSFIDDAAHEPANRLAVREWLDNECFALLLLPAPTTRAL